MFSMCLCVLYFFTTKRCTELAEVAQSSQRCFITMCPMCLCVSSFFTTKTMPTELAEVAQSSQRCFRTMFPMCLCV